MTDAEFTLFLYVLGAVSTCWGVIGGIAAIGWALTKWDERR